MEGGLATLLLLAWLHAIAGVYRQADDLEDISFPVQTERAELLPSSSVRINAPAVLGAAVAWLFDRNVADDLEFADVLHWPTIPDHTGRVMAVVGILGCANAGMRNKHSVGFPEQRQGAEPLDIACERESSPGVGCDDVVAIRQQPFVRAPDASKYSIARCS